MGIYTCTYRYYWRGVVRPDLRGALEHTRSILNNQSQSSNFRTLPSYSDEIEWTSPLWLILCSCPICSLGKPGVGPLCRATERVTSEDMQMLLSYHRVRHPWYLLIHQFLKFLDPDLALCVDPWQGLDSRVLLVRYIYLAGIPRLDQ